MANVIVTGGAGFIGRSVVKKLLQKNHSVTVLDNFSKSTYNPQGKEKVHKVDLRNAKKTSELFKKSDYCIHLAARIGGIGYFHTYPATIVSENNLMLSSVFDAAVKNKIRRIVYISSSMVYESTNTFPSSENDTEKIPMPKTSYGFSKLIGEEYCKAYLRQYGLAYTIIRPFNAYGKFEYPSDKAGMAHVIPDLLKKIYDGQYPLELMGNGKQIRTFTHVDDIADGIVVSMDHKKSVNQAYNIASSEPLQITDLAKLLWKMTNNQKKFRAKYTEGFSSDVLKRIPDVSKAERELKWKAKITLSDGLREVIQWYEKEHKKN